MGPWIRGFLDYVYMYISCIFLDTYILLFSWAKKNPQKSELHEIEYNCLK